MSFKNIHTQDYQFHANPEDPRVVTKLVPNADQADIVISGYPDDEGIKLNGGRVGASLAPHEVRKAFYKMTLGNLPASSIYDAGNVSTELDLSDRHKVAQLQNLKFYNQDKFVISIGGGHDYGYPDSQAFLTAFASSKLKPVVINFDAHLDVRPTDQGLTSGTPFHRMLTANPKKCHFYEVGIQSQCNSSTHIEWCKSQGGRIVMLDEIEKSGLLPATRKTVGTLKKNPCFISVDIDAFSSAYAPGCSQSWPVGLVPSEFLQTLDFLFQRFDVKGIGLYEVSPPLDVQPLTSRLAALILYRCLQNQKTRRIAAHEKPKRIRKR